MSKVIRSPKRAITVAKPDLPRLNDAQFSALINDLSLDSISDHQRSKINQALSVSFLIQKLSIGNTFRQVSKDLQKHLKDMRGIADFFDNTKRNKSEAKNFMEDYFTHIQKSAEFNSFQIALIEYEASLNRLLKDFKRPDKDGSYPKYYHDYLIRNLAAIAKTERVGEVKFIDAIFNILSEKDYKTLGNSWKKLGEKAQDTGLEAKEKRLNRAKKIPKK
jgi:hypothetical protein